MYAYDLYVLVIFTVVSIGLITKIN